MTEAHPLSEAGTSVEVKQLEWHGEPGWCFADTAVAHYRVSHRLNPDCYRMNSDGLAHAFYSDHATPDEARAAAQADYAQRIRRALIQPTPAETAGEVARYGAALNGWLESMEGAGTWDAATLKRLRENIGPILAEMVG